MKKRLLVSLVLIIALVICIIPLNSLAAKQVEITWTEWWDSEFGEDTMNDLIKNFEIQNPDIKVNKIFNPWFDCYNKTLALAQAGTPADVMGMEGIWMSALDKLGALEDMGPWYNKEGKAYIDRFVDPALVKYQGKIKAVYMYVYPFAVAYNQDMLKAKGLTPPKSLYEFRDQLKKFRDRKNNIYGTALPLSSEASYHLMCIFGQTLAQFGGKYVNEDGTAAFNSPQGLKALQFIKSLVDQDLVVPGSLGQTAVQTREFFGSSQIPFTYDGPFIAPIVSQRDSKVKVAFVPQMKTVTGGYLVGGSGLSLSAKSVHKEEAWKFIKYMMSDEVAKIGMKKLILPWGIKSALKDPFVVSNPVLGPCAAMINDKNSIIFPVTPEADKLQRAFADNVQAAVLGKKDVKQALADASKQWNELVK